MIDYKGLVVAPMESLLLKGKAVKDATKTSFARTALLVVARMGSHFLKVQKTRGVLFARKK